MANLADHLYRQARERGDRIALYFGAQAYSFAGLARLVGQAAALLAAGGLRSGMRVGVLLPSSPGFIIIQQSLFTLGAIPVPLNSQAQPSDIRFAISTCGLQYIVASGDLARCLPGGHANDAAFNDVIIVDEDALTTLQATRASPPQAGLVDLPDEAIGMMLCTSATTGKAKGVQLSIGNLRANYDRTPRWLGLSSRTVTLCALPLCNTFALNQCINATMVTGGTLVLLPRFDVAACLSAIETHRCTFFPAVPTMLQRLIDDAATRMHDLSSIERVLVGGAPVPICLLERVHATIGSHIVVMTGYGLTEATALVTLSEIHLARGALVHPKSIGRALPGIGLRVVDDMGQQVPPGVIGEFQVRGANVMQGYFRMPEETARVFDGDWLRTGDLGYLDAQDDAYLVDRKKDVIIRGGQNVYPADIEDVLYALPDIREAAVVGVPNDDYGELPVGFVAMRSGSMLSSDDIIAHCQANLARFKRPVAIHVLPDLPKGPTGKILRRELRAS